MSLASPPKVKSETVEIVGVKLPEVRDKHYYLNFELRIQDFGCGISKENISKLFIDFNKIGENRDLNSYGVGLGLSICKQLIKHMAGEVSVNSVVDQGTTFTILFRTTCKLTGFYSLGSHEEESPITIMFDKNGRASESPLQPINSNPVEDEKPQLLLVNDNFQILDTTTHMIESTFHVSVADNGKAAFDLLKERKRNFFDVILLDINMPIMNGFQTIELFQDYLQVSGIEKMLKLRSNLNVS
jgi:hypothetical protein